MVTGGILPVGYGWIVTAVRYRRDTGMEIGLSLGTVRWMVATGKAWDGSGHKGNKAISAMAKT
jgi:hypothetical protein